MSATLWLYVIHNLLPLSTLQCDILALPDWYPIASNHAHSIVDDNQCLDGFETEITVGYPGYDRNLVNVRLICAGWGQKAGYMHLIT